MYEICTFDNMEKTARYMDPKVFDYITECESEGFECFDDFSLFAFDYYDVHSARIETSKVMVYFDRERLLFFCEDAFSAGRIAEMMKERQPEQTATAEQLLSLFFGRLLKSDMSFLERFEQELSDAEASVLSDKTVSAPKQMNRWRRELLRLKKYYEQLCGIFDELTANENRLLSDRIVRRIAVWRGRTERYLSTVVNLRETVSQIRETYQSQLAIRQNDLMQIFTVVTVFFLPLTLIVGWYGMNFSYMPELHWKYGYPIIIAVSAAVVAFMIVWFKRKKWF